MNRTQELIAKIEEIQSYIHKMQTENLHTYAGNSIADWCVLVDKYNAELKGRLDAIKEVQSILNQYEEKLRSIYKSTTPTNRLRIESELRLIESLRGSFEGLE